MNITSVPRPVRRALTLVTAAALLLGAAAVSPSLAASAAPAATQTGPGWVRLAHLSPDTRSVDVRLTAFGGSTVLYELDNVSYGSVSPYQQLPGGSYTVTMVPAGSTSWKKPMLSSAITVTTGKAATVAAFGSNTKLAVKSFSDDLTAPQAGTARVRLIQASTKVRSVDVSTSTGMPVAENALAGSATGYAAVPAGAWTLKLKAKRITGTSPLNLAAGSITTLLVLDSSSGIVIRPVLDSAAVAQAPVGGVNTGGGWLATRELLKPAGGR